MADQNMVEPVVRLINGRGHRIWRARDVELADASDQDLVEYCLSWGLVLVTFDADVRSKAIRGQCRVVHILPPIQTARDRVATTFAEVIRHLSDGRHLVTLRADRTVQGA